MNETTTNNQSRSAQTVHLPTTVIEPRRGWRLVDLRQLWRHRELAYFLCWRDIKVRYKQTVLGILWAFIQPFMKLVVFSVIFSRFIESEGFPYPIFLFAGLLPWQFFGEALTRSSQSIVDNQQLITKVAFPRMLVPVASVGACLVDFLIAFAILAGLMVYYGVVPGVGALMIIPLVALTVIAALGAGLLLSALNVAYRDFRYVIPFLVQIWMFLTPVIYPVTIVPERWQWLLSLNPMSGIVDAYRSAILGKPFAWGNLAISAGVTVALFLFAAAYFRRLERQFADII